MKRVYESEVAKSTRVQMRLIETTDSNIYEPDVKEGTKAESPIISMAYQANTFLESTYHYCNL